MEPVLRDAYGRPLDNLRISVTRECNYRCIFCHVEGHPSGSPLPPGAGKPSMLPADYRVVARAAWRLGMTKFKLTGGEPLLRRDLEEIVSAIRDEAPTADISMTTNGYLLAGRTLRLREAGLNRVNISLHSLRRDVYRRITGIDGLGRVLLGIKEAVDAGFRQVKINVVVLKGLNEGELWDLLDFSRKLGVVLQLIELHPVGLGARSFRRYHSPLDYFEEELVKRGAERRIRELHNRPIYKLPDGAVVEIVRPYANPIFCLGCRRVRLLDDGTLSPCLNWRGPRVDLLGRIRSASSFEEKVQKAMESFKEVNRLRRPFYLWPRNDLGLRGLLRGGLRGGNNSLRLSLPKKHSKPPRD